MTRRTTLLLFLALTIGLTACAPTASSPTASPAPAQPSASALPRSEAEIPRVSVEEAKAALDAGLAILVDVRSADAFAAGHLPGAKSIPLSEIERDPSSVPLSRNRWIITYCA